MSGMSREARRRLENLARLWNPRMEAAKDDAAMAKVCFDRAKAAARSAQRGGNPRAMHDLAVMLATWAEQHEAAEARRLGRHTA